MLHCVVVALQCVAVCCRDRAASAGELLGRMEGMNVDACVEVHQVE